MPSSKDDWELQLINDKLHADSTSPDEVLRVPDIKEPAADSTSTDETWRSANYDESQQIIPDQEENGSNYDPEQETERP